MFVSISGLEGALGVAVLVVNETTDMGVSPCHALGVSPPLPTKSGPGVMLVPRLPRSCLPLGPGVITSVSFRPAATTHS